MRERATRGPDDRLFRFCTAWLAGMALGVSAAGALLALFPSSAPVQRLVNDFVDPLFFGEGADLALFGPYREWVFAVLGASLTGWGGLMAFAVPLAASRRFFVGSSQAGNPRRNATTSPHS